MSEESSSNTAPEATSESTPESTPEQGFVWWVAMLPFLAGAAIFIYKWSGNQADFSNLGWAVACLAAGVVFAAMVAGGSSSASADSSESAIPPGSDS